MSRFSRRPVYLILAFDLLVFGSAVALFAFLPGSTARLVSDFYPIVLSVLCAGIAVRIYRSLEKGRLVRRPWALLTAGFIGWALGELLWGVYDLVGREPYPSWADLFYIAGDLCLIAFFAVQVRFLRVVLGGWKRYLAIGLILSFLTLVIIAAYIPMLAQPSPDWLEVGLNLAYETLFLLILIGATVLALVLYEGWLGHRWMIFVSGIWLYAFSNQVFFYATWHNLYYPDGQVTPLSVLFDLLYIGSYLIILTGLYLRWALPFPALQAEDVLAALQKPRSWETWIVLSDEQGRASFVDPRLLPLLGTGDVGVLTGEFVGQILGLRPSVDDQMLLEAHSQGFSQPRQVLLAGGVYALQAVAEKETSSVYWLLMPWEGRSDIRPDGSFALETLLAQAVRGTVPAQSAGSRAKRYLTGVVPLLSLLCARFGGTEVARQFGRQFFPTLQACEEALEAGQPPERECQERLQQALEYVLTVVPAAEVQRALNRLESALGEDTIQAADRLGLRLRVS